MSGAFAIRPLRPVPKGRVSVGTRDGTKYVGGAEIADGHATIEATTPGRWWVVTDCTGPADIVIRSGATTHVDLRLPR